MNRPIKSPLFSPHIGSRQSSWCWAAGLGLLFALTPLIAGHSLARKIAAAGPVEPEKLPDGGASPAGLIEGLVTYRGKVPKSPVADELGVARDLLHVDRNSRGLQYVVVWVEADPVVSRRTSPPPPDGAVAPVRMIQEDYDFVPRLIAIRSGQSVTFTSSDAANHNVRASSPRPTNEFNVFTGTGQAYTHSFSADPGHRPVRLDCDIHLWMRGWIYVFDHSFFAVSDPQGRFRISGVPAGRHVLRIRQPDISYAAEKSIAVKSGQLTSIQIELPDQD